MTFKNTFVLTNIHSAIKILSAIIMNKIIAIYLGPSGLALIGQFQNFSALTQSLSNASIQTGIVKNIAENRDESSINKVSANSLFISISLSLFTSLFVIFFANELSLRIFFSEEYVFVIYFFAANIIFFSVNLYFISFLNGIRDIRLYTFANIIISLYTLFTVSLLTYLFGVEGAIFGLIISQFLVFVTVYLMIYRRRKFPKLFLFLEKGLIDRSVIKNLLTYGLASFSSGFIFAMSMLLIRAFIVSESSINDAGIWESAMKIGVYFNMIFALPLSVHFLPLFSKANNREDLTNLLKEAYVFILPLMALSIFIMSLIGDRVILILFSKEFLLASDLLIMILIAETVRMLGLICANLLVAKKWLISNITNEAVLYLVSILAGMYFFEETQLFGIIYGYLLGTLLYFLSNIFCCYRVISSGQSSSK